MNPEFSGSTEGRWIALWSWPRAVDSYGLEIQAAGAYPSLS